MFQAPPEDRPRNQSSELIQRRQQMFSQRLEEMRKTNKYAQLFDRQVDSKYRHDLDVQTDIVTVGARLLKDYRPVIGGLSGQAHAAAYYMLGAYSYLIELWGRPVFEADENGDGRVSDEEYLKWIDLELTGEGWITPHRIDHPDLGEVWIGGTAKKHIQRTPPARYMEEEALRNTQFVLYCASQFPRVKIEDVTTVPATDDLCWVEVVVKNDRVYPTSSDRAVELKRDVKDLIKVRASDNITIVDIPEAKTLVDPLNPEAWSEVVSKKGAEFRLKGKDSRRFCVLVKVEGAQGWVEFTVKSKHGGADTKRVTIKKS
jgi:hypothetical protein